MNWQTIGIQLALNALLFLVPGYLAYKRLSWILNEHRPHTHGEKEGPLTAEGVRYPREMEK